MNIVASIAHHDGVPMGYIVQLGEYFVRYDCADQIIKEEAYTNFTNLEDALIAPRWIGDGGARWPREIIELYDPITFANLPEETFKERAKKEPITELTVVGFEVQNYSLIVMWALPKERHPHLGGDGFIIKTQPMMFVELKRILIANDTVQLLSKFDILELQINTILVEDKNILIDWVSPRQTFAQILTFDEFKAVMEQHWNIKRQARPQWYEGG